MAVVDRIMILIIGLPIPIIYNAFFRFSNRFQRANIVSMIQKFSSVRHIEPVNVRLIIGSLLCLESKQYTTSLAENEVRIYNPPHS